MFDRSKKERSIYCKELSSKCIDFMLPHQKKVLAAVFLTFYVIFQKISILYSRVDGFNLPKWWKRQKRKRKRSKQQKEKNRKATATLPQM